MNVMNISQNSSPNFGAFSISSPIKRAKGQFIGVNKFLYEEDTLIRKRYSAENGYNRFELMKDVILPAIKRQENNSKMDILLTDKLAKNSNNVADVLLQLKDKMGKIVKSVSLRHEVEAVPNETGSMDVKTAFTKTLDEFEKLANK